MDYPALQAEKQEGQVSMMEESSQLELTQGNQLKNDFQRDCETVTIVLLVLFHD